VSTTPSRCFKLKHSSPNGKEVNSLKYHEPSWTLQLNLHGSFGSNWYRSKSNGSVAPTVISDDIYLLLWHWHAFKGKFSTSRSRSRFFFGTLPVRALPPKPLDLQRIWALRLWPKEGRVFPHPKHFLRTTYRFRYVGVQSSPLISVPPLKFSIFRLLLQRRLLRYIHLVTHLVRPHQQRSHQETSYLAVWKVQWRLCTRVTLCDLDLLL